MRELASTVTVDHSDRLRSVPDTRDNRDRTIHLRFARLDDGYLVQAWGSAFGPDGGGCQGRVHLGASALEAGVGDLRARWRAGLVEHVEPGVRPTRRPFVDDWDLAGRDVDEAALALARAGHDLFALLFRNGDAGLKEVCDLLLAALRTGEHVVTVESDDLFVPWGLLYVPLDDHGSVWDDDYRWDPRGFWGYRHLVEHNFSRSPGFDSRIPVKGSGLTVGMNVDEGVDGDHPPTPCVRPLIGFLSARAATTVRTTKAELADALRSPGFADDVVYFGCRGRVDEDDRRACLVLGDGEEIDSAELVSWLATGLASRPVVVVGAGEGASAFYPAFGHHLLLRGARCLVAPQVDLPRAFAREYATRLFEAFLVPGTRLGDVVRDLARAFLDEHRNPLGLVFSLHRGIDVHLAAR
ncbi:hypothetical protein [Saccharothrix luteola]|uniref:hypothetical protein n=1 Tax=Saccharothrix luteola TaxID=2893018 RepID=UPI001E591936|nr:hypothetical protein [Saccharothrix luteola]MCC8247030.1 hypothetical protein [Saccharothrix luteola]